MNTRDKLIKARLGMLALAEELQNISLACKRAGISRSHFYEIREAFEKYGADGLAPRLRRKPRMPNQMPPELEQQILEVTERYPAPEEWRPVVWIVGIFTGLRPGEIQAMRWTVQNWPDFTTNKIHVTHAYESTSKVLGAPKTDLLIRDVDMVPNRASDALRALEARRRPRVPGPGRRELPLQYDESRVAPDGRRDGCPPDPPLRPTPYLRLAAHHGGKESAVRVAADGTP